MYLGVYILKLCWKRRPTLQRKVKKKSYEAIEKFIFVFRTKMSQFGYTIKGLAGFVVQENLF